MQAPTPSDPATAAAPVNRPLRAVGYRVFAGLCLAAMGVLVKMASARGVHVLEIMFFRQLFAVPVTAAAAALGTGGIRSLGTRRFGAHVWRAGAGLIGMLGNFGALSLLPLAEATTLGFTAPIWATLISIAFLKEKVGIWRWSAIALGFIGILIVAQPGDVHYPMTGVGVALFGAFMVALVSILLRQLGATEPAATTAFWFSLLSVLPLGIALPFVHRAEAVANWPLLVGAGIAGGVGQIGLTAALRWAPVSLVVPADYTNLVWATLFGWMVFGLLPGAATWIGAPLIVASSLIILLRSRRGAR